MSIEIAREQQTLKKKHESGPHGWCSAEPREEILAQNELHLEQQECAYENCDSIGKGTTLGSNWVGSIHPGRLSVERCTIQQLKILSRLSPEMAAKLRISLLLVTS